MNDLPRKPRISDAIQNGSGHSVLKAAFRGHSNNVIGRRAQNAGSSCIPSHGFQPKAGQESWPVAPRNAPVAAAQPNPPKGWHGVLSAPLAFSKPTPMMHLAAKPRHCSTIEGECTLASVAMIAIIAGKASFAKKKHSDQKHVAPVLKKTAIICDRNSFAVV